MSATTHASGVGRPIWVALVTTLVVALLSYLLPPGVAATAVGIAFFVAVYLLVLRDPLQDPKAFGLSLGGLLESAPLQLSRIAREAGPALGWAAVLSAVVFPFYFLGYVWWWEPTRDFDWTRLPSASETFGQLLAVALPEEAFYRGYLQSALARALPARLSVLGAPFGAAVLITSAIFAAGHLATDPSLFRLLVFFPSLLFGWLRSKTGGIGASVLFHAACNLFSLYLAQGYGFIP